MEIVDGLAKDGSLFVPSDEPCRTIGGKVTQQVITFGFSQKVNFKESSQMKPKSKPHSKSVIHNDVYDSSARNL